MATKKQTRQSNAQNRRNHRRKHLRKPSCAERFDEAVSNTISIPNTSEKLPKIDENRCPEPSPELFSTNLGRLWSLRALFLPPKLYLVRSERLGRPSWDDLGAMSIAKSLSNAHRRAWPTLSSKPSKIERRIRPTKHSKIKCQTRFDTDFGTKFAPQITNIRNRFLYRN